jgi:hypothetical protein
MRAQLVGLLLALDEAITAALEPAKGGEASAGPVSTRNRLRESTAGT